MKFLDLVTHIAEVDDVARVSAGRLVQQALSLRNWIIGAGVVEFEQSGEDRAAYGERLLQRLADALTGTGCKGLSARNLKNFRQVALAYAGLDGFGLGRRLGLFPVVQRFGIRQTSAESPALLFPSLARRAAEHTHLPWRDSAWLMRLFTELTFSHLLELSRIDELSRRGFYELYCLKERWSVRNLLRQQDSLLFERIGLSEKRDEILEFARQGTVPNTPEEASLALVIPHERLQQQDRAHRPWGELPTLGADQLAALQAPAGPGAVYVIQLAAMTHTQQPIEPARALAGALPAPGRAQVDVAHGRKLCGAEPMERFHSHGGFNGGATKALSHAASLRSRRRARARNCA